MQKTTTTASSFTTTRSLVICNPFCVSFSLLHVSGVRCLSTVRSPAGLNLLSSTSSDLLQTICKYRKGKRHRYRQIHTDTLKCGQEYTNKHKHTHLRSAHNSSCSSERKRHTLSKMRSKARWSYFQSFGIKITSQQHHLLESSSRHLDTVGDFY